MLLSLTFAMNLKRQDGMKLFHGSITAIEKPCYGKGNPYNDYGLGLYTSDNYELAAEWAVDIDRDGYVNEYEIKEDDFLVYNFNVLMPLHWDSTILRYRYQLREWGIHENNVLYLIDIFSFDPSKYDIVIGNRADDAYFTFVESFVNGTFSLQQLQKVIRSGDWGKQIVLISKQSFDALIFTSSTKVLRTQWYEKRKWRNTHACISYKKLLDEKKTIPRAERKMELTITDIVAEKMTPSSPEIENIAVYQS